MHHTKWRRFVPAFILTCVLTGCGGTWVDDGGDFERVFGFAKPPEVTVLHSYYWKSSHWSTEYRYFIALRASEKFAAGLTSSEVATAATAGMAVLDACRTQRPSWFAPKPLSEYEILIPRGSGGYRIFRDKASGVLFLCDQRL